MADLNIDKTKLEAIQKLMQSDPRLIEKVMGQITPEQINAALNLFGSLDSQTQANIGSMITGFKQDLESKGK